jgi:hypothetical protein
MLLIGGSSVWAEAKTLPYSYGFEDYNLATDGWTTANPSGKNSGEFGITGTSNGAVRTGSYGFRFSSYSTNGENTQYLISPELSTDNGGITVSFYYKASSTSSSGEKFKVGYSTTDTDLSSFAFDVEYAPTSTTWTEYNHTFPAGTKYIAIYYYANYQYRLLVDDFTFEAVENIVGPAFAIKDGTTTINSPYAYNFGLATAGTTKTFTLSNPGTEATPIALSATGNVGASIGEATSIAAGGEVTLTLTMPDANASGTVTVTPTGDGLSAFTFNVSGTKRDASKVYESGFTSLPEDWTTTGTWYYSAANGAYTQVWYLSSNARLITPKLTIAEGEKFFVEAKGFSTSNTSYQHLQMQYSADGTSWTNFGDEPALDPSNWNTFEITGCPAGSYYIAINASQADIRMFYGGQLPLEPKMVVTQPATLDFGLYDKDANPAPTKTFTIANTGLATLNGISVTSENDAFVITNAPTSLAAGASQEVTITMSTATTGALSSLITVSATDMTDATFTVTGTIKPAGMAVEEFTDGLPANWTNASWTFANGEATGKSSSAYLTTPKLTFSAGDFIIIKAKRYDSDTSDYLTVQGSNDNGSTWTAYSKKLQNADGLDYPDYGTMVLSDIPTTVNRLRFVGYYCVVDEIHGLTYAPVLSVTKEAAAVSTPANYDFGECAADANVTYNFANTGAGTINITNVAITGEGAAVYSTNWTTSVSAPFDLTISRSYDSNRVGASEATITVTTSEGNFVINVTGTDKAANAPELAVSTNAIDFGKLTDDAVETVTVTNNGTGSMDVTIASDSEDFEVSTTSLTGIGAGESKTFNITFKYGTPYGVKNGNVTVTPTYNVGAAETITVTAKAKNPATWSEDFTGNTKPTGWDAGANWTFAEGKAKAAYAYGTTSYLTTPALTVAGTTDEMSFDYQATANYVSIKIQYSKDGAAFTDLHTISGLSNGDAGTYTITGLEAGNYQFRFANDDYELDNFEGFILNLPDHICVITASSIPTSNSYSITMKEGQSFNATVTVKENRGVAETVTAKLYMGSTVIGTNANVNIEANESKVITIECTPTTSAPTGVEMHIEVEYAGGTLSTTPETRYVAAITNLILDEKSDDAVVADTYDNVTLKRKFVAGWNTVCLPFTISDVEAFFGTGAKSYNFTSYSEGILSFNAVDELTASYPYIVYVPAAITEDIELHNITIANGDKDPWYRYQSGAYFRGTYAPVAAGEWTKTASSDVIYGVTSAGKIAKAGASASIDGFRAYFDLPAGATVRLAIIDESGETTIINGIVFDAEDSKVYNLNGQRVETMKRGQLYIVNGKKVVK